MWIVDKEKLVQRGKVFFYDGKLFDGVSYIRAGDFWTEPTQYENGRPIPLKRPDLPIYESSKRIVDYDRLDPKEEDYHGWGTTSFLFKGNAFTDLAMIIGRENAYELGFDAEGWVEFESHYSKGVRTYFCHDAESFSQNFGWDSQSGKLTEVFFREGLTEECILLWLWWDQNGRLYYIDARLDTFEFLDNLKPVLYFDSPTSFQEIGSMPTAPILRIDAHKLNVELVEIYLETKIIEASTHVKLTKNSSFFPNDFEHFENIKHILEKASVQYSISET